LPRRTADHEHAQSLRTRVNLAFGAGAHAHEGLTVELHALAFDVDPARACDRDEYLLLPAVGMIVLGIVAVIGGQLDRLYPERAHAELGSDFHACPDGHGP